MNIKKENNCLVLRLPLSQKENNCYMDNEDLREVPNLIGVVDNQKREYFISQLCDLSYKDDQQEGIPYIVLTDENEVKEICKEFDLDIWYH